MITTPKLRDKILNINKKKLKLEIIGFAPKKHSQRMGFILLLMWFTPEAHSLLTLEYITLHVCLNLLHNPSGFKGLQCLSFLI